MKKICLVLALFFARFDLGCPHVSHTSEKHTASKTEQMKGFLFNIQCVIPAPIYMNNSYFIKKRESPQVCLHVQHAHRAPAAQNNEGVCYESLRNAKEHF